MWTLRHDEEPSALVILLFQRPTDKDKDLKQKSERQCGVKQQAPK